MFGLIGGLFKGVLGASVITGGAIYKALQHAKSTREINTICSNAAKANFQNRAVAVLPKLNTKRLRLVSGDARDNDVYDIMHASPTYALDYIRDQNEQLTGAVVSGGRTSDRVRALMPFVQKAKQDSIPVVALHSGSTELTTMISTYIDQCEFISRTQLYYDVFRGMPIDDMASLLFEIMPEDTASPQAEALLRSLLEVVLLTKGAVTLQDLATFSLPELQKTLDVLKINGVVTDNEYREIDRNYKAGSSNLDAVRIFLSKLNRQAEAVYGTPANNNCNIKRVLNLKGAIAIDIGTARNDLVCSLVIEHLMLLQAQGRSFSILLDDIPLSKFSKVSDLLRGRTYAISNNDFIASLHGGERNRDDLFAELLGNVSVIVLFSHVSGASREKWSEHLGKYRKIRIKFNITQNTAFLNSSNSRGVSVDEADEPRVRAETLGILPESVACIHTSGGTLFAPV